MEKINQISQLNSSELFESCFRRMHKVSVGRIRKKKRFVLKRETEKVKAFANCLSERLSSYINSFPRFEEVHPFYQELIELIESRDEYKKSLGHLSKLNKIIRNIRTKTVKEMHHSGKEEEIIAISRGFFGRINSLKKDLEKETAKMNRIAFELKEFPSIEFDAPTIILAGIPNAGKTTVLKRLTGAKARIASWPFTTQKIQLGYFTERYYRIQVIDTPGLLDREESKRNPIERKAVDALKNLQGIIAFVFDPVQQKEEGIKAQLNLIREIKAHKKRVVVLINKSDIAGREEIGGAEEKIRELKEEFAVCGEGREKELREFIVAKLREEKLIK
ncbi:MAG: GTPase [Candidatus Diapherotrites archaeon]